jgi:hypothetical protein
LTAARLIGVYICLGFLGLLSYSVEASDRLFELEIKQNDGVVFKIIENGEKILWEPNTYSAKKDQWIKIIVENPTLEVRGIEIPGLLEKSLILPNSTTVFRFRSSKPGEFKVKDPEKNDQEVAVIRIEK